MTTPDSPQYSPDSRSGPGNFEPGYSGSNYGPGAAYPAPYYPGYVPDPPLPGRTLGIVGFIFSFFGVLDVLGLIFCIVALVQARRVGRSNGLAIAGIIIGSVGVVILALVLIFAVPAVINAAQECARLGTGVHQVGNATYTCTPHSFGVTSN